MLPEVGVPEFLLIGVIALIVVGPKDLPMLMRKVGKFVAHLRGMASEFRASFDELARQSELDELRKEVEAMRQAAQQPAHAAMQAAGLGEVSEGLSQAHAEIRGHLMDPHETPQAHVGPLGEPMEPDAPAAEPEAPALEDATQPEGAATAQDTPAAEARH